MAGMHIGFDAKRAFHNHTGLGVYCRALLLSLIQHHGEHRYTLFDARPHRSLYRDLVCWPTVSSRVPGWRSFWMSRSISRSGCRIYHGLSHELPLGIGGSGSIPVVTIHDVVFRRDPGLYPWLDRKIYHRKWAHSTRQARAIVAVSQHTARDLMELYGVPAAKLRVIGPPVALPPPAPPEHLARTRQHFGLPENFLLSVGALTARKNVMAILTALAQMQPADRMPLVVVGSGPQEKELQYMTHHLGLQGLVLFTGHTDRHRLAHLYQLAHALVYPSHYEGFGLPLVESLHYGRPVVTSATSSMPEAAGPGGLLIDPSRPQTLAHAITRLVTDAALYDELAHRGRAHARQFEPKLIADRHLALYRELLED